MTIGSTDIAKLSSRNRARIVLLILLVVAIVVGLGFWSVVDWTVYRDTYVAGGGHELKPDFKLTPLEQVAMSSVVVACAAVALFAVAWLVLPNFGKSLVVDKVALTIAIGGAVVGWGLLYVARRMPGDVFTPSCFLGLSFLEFFMLGLPVLLLCEAVAFVLGVIARRDAWGKAAMIVSVLSIAPLLFYSLG